MNSYQIQKQLRAQLEPMTDKELEETEHNTTRFKHPTTNEAFNELAAAYLAAVVKRNPRDMARIKRVAWRFPGLTEAFLAHCDELIWDCPGLAEALGTHFPEDKDPGSPPNARTANNYRRAVGHIGPCGRGPRVCDILQNAERRAARIALVEDEKVNDAEVHLREERIDALASLIALFSLPDRYAASPVQTEDNG